MNSEHLTVEQMEALLSNPELRERSQHLQVCGRCSEEFESLHAVMCELRAAVIASSEVHRRLAVMPEPAHRTPRALWSLVAAAALLCASSCADCAASQARACCRRPAASTAGRGSRVRRPVDERCPAGSELLGSAGLASADREGCADRSDWTNIQL